MHLDSTVETRFKGIQNNEILKKCNIIIIKSKTYIINILV